MNLINNISYTLCRSQQDIDNLYAYIHGYEYVAYPKEALIDTKYKDFYSAFCERLNTAKGKLRKNAILMVDIVVRCPHNNQPNKINNPLLMEEWKKASVTVIQRIFGDENVIAATFHDIPGDYHIHFAVVPIINGRLCWSRYIKYTHVNKFEVDYTNLINEELYKHVSSTLYQKPLLPLKLEIIVNL